MTPPPRLNHQLVAFFVTRTVLNTLYRMVYPFTTILARGMGVPVTDVAAAIAVRSGLGLAAPLLGSTADRRGRKEGMLIGLLLFSAGAAIVGLLPAFGPFVAAMLMTAAGKIIFDPSMQAYLGDVTGYHVRGRAIALTELGWSLAFLLGVPLMGLVIAGARWSTPFPVLAVLGMTAAAILWRLLPADPGSAANHPSLRQSVGHILAHRSALAALAVGLMVSAANETVNIVFGVWLEASFGLQVAALGAAAAVIGLAELAGEGGVIAAADRLGKPRAVAIGLVLNAVACLLLPILGGSAAGALLALFLFYLTFEFTLVSTLPLMTEQVPQARATLMSANVAGLSAGRVGGAALGLALYPFGLQANTLATVALNAIALMLLLVFVRETAASPLRSSGETERMAGP